MFCFGLVLFSGEYPLKVKGFDAWSADLHAHSAALKQYVFRILWLPK